MKVYTTNKIIHTHRETALLYRETQVYTVKCHDHILPYGKSESTVAQRMTHRGGRCILGIDTWSSYASCLEIGKQCNVLTPLLQPGCVSYTEGLAIAVFVVDVVVFVVVVVVVFVAVVVVFVVVVVVFVVVVVAFVDVVVRVVVAVVL